MKTKINLKALSEEDLTLFMESLGQKPYRVRQIIGAIYGNLSSSIDEMTTLSMDLRAELKERAYISNLKFLHKRSSRDGSKKFLFSLEDGESIESVLIPDDNRLTLCVSSQVGCARGCRFCSTGRIGLKRNLKSYEITDQIISVIRLVTRETDRDIKRRYGPITNIVFMGMGEPLDNFDEVVSALRSIIHYLGFPKRSITLSTAGVVPKMKLLGQTGLDVNLAVSLNATTDRVRNIIMPINRQYPLQDLITTCRKYPLAPRRRITFEYVLLHGMNDSSVDAGRLKSLLHGIRCKINIIPYNDAAQVLRQEKSLPGDLRDGKRPSGFRKPPEDSAQRFQKALLDAGFPAMIRSSRGDDISAACGQLKADYPVTRRVKG